MLTATEAIHSLEQALARAIAGLRMSAIEFGRPGVVENAAQKAEAAFQHIASARPSKEDAYEAALTFARGRSLTDRQYDLLITSALCEPLREQQGARVIGHAQFNKLLGRYAEQAASGELWRLTWYGLLASYFSFEAGKATDHERAGWSSLRDMLKRSWPHIDRESGHRIVPDWVKVMRRESQLLTDAAADKYSADYLEGRDEVVQQLAEDLGIPQSSWFWNALVLGAVRACCDLTRDTEFKARIPRLLELLRLRPVFRDESLELILKRYHRCASKEAHPELRDFVVHKDVWRNPKLKVAGLATAWNRVPEPVWQMVLGWINEANLKLFFELLAGRSGSDEGRLNFWSRYLEQITWTRLIFGSQTVALARGNPEIRRLIAQEEGAYATLTGNRDVDAFMMRIDDYLIVEFSKTGYACNVYPPGQVPFDPYVHSYSGGTNDLRHGYHGGAAIRISHFEGWEERADAELKQIGIYPDRHTDKRRSAVRVAPPVASRSDATPSVPSLASVRALGAPRGAAFTMESLTKLVSSFHGAYIKDSRGASRGRLWIEDPQQNSSLAAKLKAMGFKWANSRTTWYYPDD